MGVVGKFGFDKVRAKLMQQKGITNDDYIFRKLSKIAEDTISHARRYDTGGKYTDRTANLRNSIGARIYHGTDIVQEFEPIKVVSASPEYEDGVIDQEELVEITSMAIDRFNNLHGNAAADEWRIVIVAGMNYAKYVESKGYNVLHLSKIYCDEQVQELKRKLGIG